MNVRTQARSAAQSGAAALHSFLLNAATFLRLAVAWFEMLVGYVAGAGVGTLEGLVRAVQSSRGRQALEGAASAPRRQAATPACVIFAAAPRITAVATATAGEQEAEELPAPATPEPVSPVEQRTTSATSILPVSCGMGGCLCRATLHTLRFLLVLPLVLACIILA